MQAKINLRYWLAAVVLCSLLLAPSVFASAQSGPLHFEQKMDMALKIWYSQHSDQNPNDLHISTVSGTGSITGTVLQGNEPIEGAVVFCWAVLSDQMVSQSAKTDAGGNYTLENLDAGDYYVVASAEGFEPAFYGGGMSPFDAEMVSVAEGEETSGIDITLKSAKKGDGAISGTVVGEEAIAGAWVVAFSRGNPFGMQNAFAITESDGSYKIDNLGQGMYVVAAYANGYIPEVYDDATSLLDIDLVTVANEEVTGINFVLEKGGSISGHVQDDQGEPLANMKIVARSNEAFMPGASIPGLSTFLQMDYTDADGNYKIEGLSTGEYVVSACLCDAGAHGVIFYDGKTDINDADLVSVTQGEETTGIDFTLELPTAKISGVVTDTDGQPLKNIYIYYVQENEDFYSNWGRLWKSAMTDENGYYELDHLAAGTYYVSAWYWDWMKFSGVWYENADSLKDATPITLEDGQVRDDINMTLDMTGDYGSISGAVTLDDSGDPVAYAFVEAIPLKKNSAGRFHKRFPTMFAFTDESGNYTINPVFKGDYYVVVKANGYKEYYDDKQEMDDADVVTVTAGEVTSDINFAIPELPEDGSVVSGVVTDESTNEPIAGALVAVFPSKKHRWFDGNMPKWNKVYYTTFTDDQGAYKIGGIPEGKYVVASWARDYVAEFYDDVRFPFKATVLELDGAATMQDINFALMPRRGKTFAEGPGHGRFGSIGGRIQSQGGLPVESAFIYAIDSEGAMVASEISGEDGSYALDGLEEGEYTILASRALYEETYYPNTTEMSQATVLSVSESGEMDYTTADITLMTSEITSVDNEISATAPGEFTLSQNYPNPFNPTTVIEYQIPEAANVSLQVYNVQGQLVKTLTDHHQAAGAHKVVWDGTDMSGRVVPAGVYLYQITANDFTAIRSLVFMK